MDPKPMLALKAPLVTPPAGQGWLFERKFDGWRAFAGLVGDKPYITTREGADITHAFPEVLPLLLALPWADVCLDGEIVGANREAVAWRAGLARPGDLAVKRAPCRFMAFDLLLAGGSDLRGGPFVNRKELLRAVLRSAGRLDAYVPAVEDGAALWAKAIREGWEGIVAKRRDSTYQSGRRSPDWIKVKVSAAQAA